MENVRIRVRIQFIEKDDDDKMTKNLSKVAPNGIHKSNKNYNSYIFKENEVLIDKPFF